MRRIPVSALVASAVILLACQDNPNAPSALPGLPTNATISKSKSTAPGARGMSQRVAQLEQDVVALGNIFGVTPQPSLGNNGIPHRLDAAAEQIQVIQEEINDLVSQHNAAIAEGTATIAGLEAFVAQLESAKLLNVKINADAVSIGDMFDMQLFMNSLSQLSEMSTAVVSAMNATIAGLARDIKS